MKTKNLALFLLMSMTASLAVANDHHAERMLSHLDENDDGQISIDEFKLPGKRMLKRADENDDGLITLDEMQSSMNKHHEERQAETQARHDKKMEALTERFANMDADGDGFVTSDEARIAAFNHMDENQDGVISKDEIKPPKGKGHHGKKGGKQSHDDD